MLKNRVFLSIGILSLLLVTVAVSRPLLNPPVPTKPAISDLYQHFYQRDRESFAYRSADDLYRQFRQRDEEVFPSEAADGLYRHFHQRDTDWGWMSGDLTP